MKYHDRANHTLRVASYKDEIDAKKMCHMLNQRVIYGDYDPLENFFMVHHEDCEWIKHPTLLDNYIKLSIHFNEQEKCDVDQDLIEEDEAIGRLRWGSQYSISGE